MRQSRSFSLVEVALSDGKEAITISERRLVERQRADRENYAVNQEMSPRLAAFIKMLENGSPEFSTEMLPGEKQDTKRAVND